jgi:hypothetical protein
VFVIARPGDKPLLLAQGLTNAADLSVESTTNRLLIPDMGGGKLFAMSITTPGAEINEEPLPLKTALAFPDLQWAGWKGESDDGRIHTLRPIVLTHAGDGSNRVFVATQHGVIHAFPNDQTATRTTIFLDIQDKVAYNDNTNEEGFLGLTFHPRFKENSTPITCPDGSGPCVTTKRNAALSKTARFPLAACRCCRSEKTSAARFIS